jgi:hypothetical protein
MLKVTASSRASPLPQVLQRLGSTLRLEDQHRQWRQVSSSDSGGNDLNGLIGSLGVRMRW